MHVSTNTSTVKVYICIPDYLLKKVIIPINVQVCYLLTVYNENSSDYFFIHNGNLIDPKATFEQNKISDEGVLIAVKKKNKEIASNINLSLQIQKLIKDQSFDQKLKMLADSKFKLEQSRLIDLKYKRIENNCRLFAKKTRSFLNKKNDQIDNHDEFDLNISYQPLIQPCEEAIPILW